MTNNPIAENITRIRAKIAEAAVRVGRGPHEVRLIAVTKTHPAEIAALALAAGVCDLGENRVQEAEAKILALTTHKPRTWHLIGHLQSNKAKRAAQLFDMIQSVDTLHLAETLNRHAADRTQPLDILIQVNVSGEASKDGFDLSGWQQHQEILSAFTYDIERITQLPNIRIRGLMTIAPIGTPTESQQHFHATRLLRDQLQQQFPACDWSQLSMGMTDDFTAAIAEGATMIRIGRAIFGSR
jgi:pyridoxal phosphate enzyme (YggS family)